MAMSDWRIVRRRGFQWLECTPLSRVDGFVHAFGTREYPGRSDASDCESTPQVKQQPFTKIDAHTKAFFREIGAWGFTLAVLRQVHSADLFRAVRSDRGIEYQRLGLSCPPNSEIVRVTDSPCGDALLTDERGILLAVKTADCMPILLVDSERRASAAVHAGWRGTLAGVVPRAVEQMGRVFGSDAATLIVAIGPSIRSCCYEVGEDVVQAFRKELTSEAGPGLGRFIVRRGPGNENEPESRIMETSSRGTHYPRADGPGRTFLDLVSVTQWQLVSTGVSPALIHTADFCTGCRTDLFFSYRKEGERSGRMLTFIGMAA